MHGLNINEIVNHRMWLFWCTLIMWTSTMKVSV